MQADLVQVWCHFVAQNCLAACLYLENMYCPPIPSTSSIVYLPNVQINLVFAACHKILPKFTESIEFRVVKLDWRRSYARIWAALKPKFVKVKYKAKNCFKDVC